MFLVNEFVTKMDRCTPCTGTDAYILYTVRVSRNDTHVVNNNSYLFKNENRLPDGDRHFRSARDFILMISVTIKK